jgi:hypothetical protein
MYESGLVCVTGRNHDAIGFSDLREMSHDLFSAHQKDMEQDDEAEGAASHQAFDVNDHGTVDQAREDRTKRCTSFCFLCAQTGKRRAPGADQSHAVGTTAVAAGEVHDTSGKIGDTSDKMEDTSSAPSGMSRFLSSATRSIRRASTYALDSLDGVLVVGGDDDEGKGGATESGDRGRAPTEAEVEAAVHELLCNPDTIKPIHVVLDDSNSPLGGLDALSRKELYTLSGVEVLTSVEFEAMRLTTESAASTSICSARANIQRAKIWCSVFGYVCCASLTVFLVPIPLAGIAFWLQSGLKATSAVRAPIVVEDLVFKPFSEEVFRSRSIPVEAAAFLGCMCGYYFVGGLKLFMFFLAVDASTQARRVVRRIFLAATTAYVFLAFVVVYNALLWITLGAILNPVSILPYSVAITGATAFLVLKYRAAMSLKRTLKKKMQLQIQAKLTKVVNASTLKERSDQVKRAKTQKGTELRRQQQHLKGAGEPESKREAHQSSQDTTPIAATAMTPKDIFASFDEDGDQLMSVQEYLRLLEELRLTISEAKALRIFARCDKGGVGSLTLEEFKACWKALSDSIASDAMCNIGITEGTLMFGLLSSGIFLTLLFCFVFFAVSAFGGQGSFGSGVRGMMAAAAARLGGSVGDRTMPEPSAQRNAATDALAVLQSTETESGAMPDDEEKEESSRI